MTTYTFLSTHDKFGVPDSINSEPIETISDELIDEINSTLTEGNTIYHRKPHWIRKSDIFTTDNCEIKLTFVNEGAGYKNGLGYYVYDKDHPPNRFSDITNIFIIFPNASLNNKGGKLVPGNTMKLVYEANSYDQAGGSNKRFMTENSSNNFIFPAGKGIGFVCLSNRWKNNGNTNAYLGVGHGMYSTDPSLNPESPGLKDHSVNFASVSSPGKIIYGFEDLRRDIWSDNDFNDLVYYITATPFSSIDGNSYNSTVEQKYKGFILCEDIKPGKGDFDYNDLIMKYNVTESLEYDKLKSITIKLQGLSRGASYNHDFGVVIPGIKSMNCKIYREIWIAETDTTIRKTITNEVVGTATDKIKLIENTYEFLPTHMSNTTGEYILPSYSLVRIDFLEGVETVNGFPYRFYLDIYGKGSIYSDAVYETSKALQSKGILLKNKIKILKDVESFRIPKEKVPLRKVYKRLEHNLKSNGKLFSNWYSSQYMDENKVRDEIVHTDASHNYSNIFIKNPYKDGLLIKDIQMDEDLETKFNENSMNALLSRDNMTTSQIADWNTLPSSFADHLTNFGDCYIKLNGSYGVNNFYYCVSINSGNPNTITNKGSMYLYRTTEIKKYVALVL